VGLIEELFAQGAAPPPWGRIAATFLGGAQLAASRVSDQVLQWGSLLVRNATLRWAQLAASQVFCSMQDCKAQALVVCAACERPFCLGHSLVSHHAEGICEACALGLVTQARAARPRREAPRAAQAAAAKPDPVPAALRALRLTKNASFAEIKSAYKKLCVKHNADRPQSEAQRQKNTARLQEINGAYEVLRKRYEREAA
jgi:hypothetical protein